MLMDVHTATGRIFVGNILFIVCCAFYLAWWLLRFRPANPIMGMKTGWLLMPAAVAGLVGVVFIVLGVSNAQIQGALFPRSYAIWGALVAYIVFYAVTRLLFDRQVTSELLLITIWGALALSEVNVLYGSQLFSRGLLFVFIAVIAIVMIVDLVCYVLYYRLNDWQGYIDGMIPLLLAALTLAGVSICMAINSGR